MASLAPLIARSRAFLHAQWQVPADLPSGLRTEWRLIAIRWIAAALFGLTLPLAQLPPERQAAAYGVVLLAGLLNLGYRQLILHRPGAVGSGFITSLGDTGLHVAMIIIGGGFDSPFYFVVFSLIIAVAMRYGYGPSLTVTLAIVLVDSPDARTVTVTWRQPYIQADQLFTTARTMPKHLLEKSYLEDKEGFKNLPYWTTEYVSNGPYRLSAWETGVLATLDAYDGYQLGRPKIDQINVRFIADSNTMLANVLSDAIDVLVGARHLGFDQGLEAQARWQGGTVVFGANGWSVVHPQMSYANPKIIQESAQFRRAIFMASDRQAMADTLQGGVAPVAHSMFVPSDPFYEPTLPRLVKYDYDPRRSAQLIEELGYRKGGDGNYIDSSGQPLKTELRTTADIESTVKQMFAMADSWTRLGVPTDTYAIPPQRQQDREFRSTFPGFEVLQGGQGQSGLTSRTIANARTPQNNWTGAGGTNYSNYVNPEHDAMIARFLSAIPMNDRVRLAGDLLNHLSENALYMGVYYVARPTVVRNGLTGTAGRDAGTVATHNAYLWDLRQ